jgi:heme A synthase
MQRESASGIDRGFVRLALGAIVVTFLMIVIGAITRVTGSGMGCGTHWPLCNGHIIPEFTSMEVFIENSHRWFAIPVGGFAVALLIRALQRHRNNPMLLWPAILGVVLYVLQALLGALTVKLNNQWVSVLTHLTNSMFLLACFLVAWANARKLGANNDVPRTPELSLAPVVMTTILTLMVALIGATVAGNDAAKACEGYPLCGGQLWPVEQGPLQTLNMLHRLVAGSLGVMLVLLVLRIRRDPNRSLRRAIFGALHLYLFQALLGALVVLVDGPDWFLGMTRALHVTFAAATWSIMVIVSTIVWLQQLSINNKTNQVNPATAASATT